MIKKLFILLTALLAGINCDAQDLIKTNSIPGILKNGNRIMVGAGGFGEDGGLALNIAYEVLGLQKKISMLSAIDNAGIGFASNNLMDMFMMRQDGSGSVEAMYWSKHYLSAYLFKEFDSKFVSFGLLAGPGLNYTTGRYEFGPTSSNTELKTSFFTGGLQTGEYLHKYFGTNKTGEKAFFIRLGLQQFIMAKGATANAVNLTFGF